MGNASNFVEGVDKAFFVILGISIFFLVVLTAIMLFFVFRYSRKRNPKATQIHGNVTAELLWTIGPMIIVLVMFWYGYTGFRNMREIPDDAMVVKATARMWDWEFEYDSGKKSRELYVPKGIAVKLDMISTDVIHSLYIPAFRVKEDIVPGRENLMWFIANEDGRYDILCTEYCGLQHSYMTTVVNVIPETDFNTWVADLSDQPKEEDFRGLDIMKANACTSCHSTDGRVVLAPSFLGLYGSTKTVITDGNEREVVADDEYIRNSIKEPNKDVVKGFNQGIMQAYKDVINDEDIQSIIDYLKTLKAEENQELPVAP